MVRLGLSILAVLGFLTPSYSQDTLPEFSATTHDYKRVVISWTNPFPIVKQISVQRSFDSLKNFKTIMTVPDPSPPQNGYVDQKSTSRYTYYRLFVVLDSGKYVFSKSRRAELDSGQVVSNTGEEIPVNGSKQVYVAETLTPEPIRTR